MKSNPEQCPQPWENSEVRGYIANRLELTENVPGFTES